MFLRLQDDLDNTILRKTVRIEASRTFLIKKDIMELCFLNFRMISIIPSFVKLYESRQWISRTFLIKKDIMELCFLDFRMISIIPSFV
jgi:hypothetical protein